jgi:Uma2 family endonuclease
MANRTTRKRPEPAGTLAPRKSHSAEQDAMEVAKAQLVENTSKLVILEPLLARDYIRERQKLGIDKYDEVCDGVYIVPPLANNPHQVLGTSLAICCSQVVTLEGRGLVMAGANVSDRREGWAHSFRAPDVVVVLNGSRAVDCTTHWFGGPDFLIEVQSPDDDTDEKVPFYSRIQVRELLIVHRDTRQLRLYRHDGQQLVQLEAADFEGAKWLVSEVVPLAFRRIESPAGPRIELRRTDGKPGQWTA